MCTGNTIKREAADADNCDADVPCDGVITVPNAGHTACGKFVCSEFKGVFSVSASANRASAKQKH